MKGSLSASVVLIAAGFTLSQGPSNTGASISGRVVVEPGTQITSAVGLRVNASPDKPWNTVSATVAPDWSFRMAGLAGLYTFTASADREPFVTATRIVVDGAEWPSSASIPLPEGSHDVVVYVAPRENPPSTVERSLSTAALVDRFTHEG